MLPQSISFHSQLTHNNLLPSLFSQGMNPQRKATGCHDVLLAGPVTMSWLSGRIKA